MAIKTRHRHLPSSLAQITYALSPPNCFFRRNEIRSTDTRLAQVCDDGRGQEDEGENPRIFPSRVFRN